MRLYYWNIFFVVLVLFASCKEKTNPPITQSIDASNITMTDNLGNITGTVDSSDWTTDNFWSAEEYNLFAFSYTLNTDSVEEADTIFTGGMPNPIASSPYQFNFYYQVNVKTLLKIVIVDAYLKKQMNLAMIAEAKNGGTIQTIDCYKLPINNYFRLYYAFCNSSGVIYKKGHGDFLVTH